MAPVQVPSSGQRSDPKQNQSHMWKLDEMVVLIEGLHIVCVCGVVNGAVDRIGLNWSHAAVD